MSDVKFASDKLGTEPKFLLHKLICDPISLLRGGKGLQKLFAIKAEVSTTVFVLTCLWLLLTMDKKSTNVLLPQLLKLSNQWLSLHFSHNRSKSSEGDNNVDVSTMHTTQVSG